MTSYALSMVDMIPATLADISSFVLLLSLASSWKALFISCRHFITFLLEFQAGREELLSQRWDCVHFIIKVVWFIWNWIKRGNSNEGHAHRHQQSEPLLVLYWAAIVSRILPVQINTIKVMSTQKTDCRRDESCTTLRFHDHGNESEESKVLWESSVSEMFRTYKINCDKLTGSLH